MTEERGQRWRLSRDSVLLSFALTLAAVEIVLFEARPAVLTFVSGLLLSPLVLRADEVRRSGSRKNNDQ